MIPFHICCLHDCAGCGRPISLADLVPDRRMEYLVAEHEKKVSIDQKVSLDTAVDIDDD